jgi:hypothetical protein
MYSVGARRPAPTPEEWDMMLEQAIQKFLAISEAAQDSRDEE